MADYAAEIGVTAGTPYQWRRRLADYAELNETARFASR
jgi:transposase-like protein